MSEPEQHNYPELMKDFGDIEVYKDNKDICVCDKSLDLHYAIANQILHMTHEYIPIIKNYSCLYCYNEFHIEQKEDKTISIDEIKNIFYSSPSNILEIKNKYGDTPLDIIFKILRILNFEIDNPYNNFRTRRELEYYIGILENIEEILKMER